MYASKFNDERVKPERLYTCNARIYDEYANDEQEKIYLYSYNTLVAIYDTSTLTVYRCGRFSNTTYQHMRKFRKWCWEKYHHTLHECDIKEVMYEIENWYK